MYRESILIVKKLDIYFLAEIYFLNYPKPVKAVKQFLLYIYVCCCPCCCCCVDPELGQKLLDRFCSNIHKNLNFSPEYVYERLF